MYIVGTLKNAKYTSMLVVAHPFHEMYIVGTLKNAKCTAILVVAFRARSLLEHLTLQ